MSCRPHGGPTQVLPLLLNARWEGFTWLSPWGMSSGRSQGSGSIWLALCPSSILAYVGSMPRCFGPAAAALAESILSGMSLATEPALPLPAACSFSGDTSSLGLDSNPDDPMRASSPFSLAPTTLPSIPSWLFVMCARLVPRRNPKRKQRPPQLAGLPKVLTAEVPSGLVYAFPSPSRAFVSSFVSSWLSLLPHFSVSEPPFGP